MSRSPESDICRYRYDALDRVVCQTLRDAPECQRFYCKNHLATEVHKAVAHSLFQYADQLLAQRRSEGDAFDVTLLAADQQRSVLQSVRANTLMAIVYTPYGHRIGESGLTSLLGFNGERLDSLTGHYLLGNGYRAFNPMLMRFNSPDGFSPFGKGGVNSYTYCLGDPVNNSDPTGKFILPSRLKVMVRGWVEKARENLSLSIGTMVDRKYFPGASAINKLGIAKGASDKSDYLVSFSSRTSRNPGMTRHYYSSGKIRKKNMYPTRAQMQFDKTPGSELDAIFRDPSHPQYDAVTSVHQQNSEVNIYNHLSVANPVFSGAQHAPDPGKLWANIDSGLTGNIPGVMPSMLIRMIRSGQAVPPGISSAAAQLPQRYPQFFNQSPTRKLG